MKTAKTVVSFTFSIVLLFLLTGCGSGGVKAVQATAPLSPTPSAPALKSMALASTSTTIVIGGMQQLAVTGSYSDGSTKDLSTTATWISSDVTVVTVASGLVTAVKVGSATITATSGSYSASTPITVSAVPLTSVSFLPASLTMASGTTQQFTATVANNANPAVTYSASTGTISASGLYAAPVVTIDTTLTITATSVADATKSATITVLLKARVITLTDVVPPKFYLPGGSNDTVTLTFDATGAAVGDVLWSSMFPSVTLTSSMNLNHFSITFKIGPSYYPYGPFSAPYAPGAYRFQLKSGDSNDYSNVITSAFQGNQNTLAVSKDGRLYQLDQSMDTIWIFNSDGTPVLDTNGANKGFSVWSFVSGIAIDDQTGLLVVSTYGGSVEYLDPVNGYYMGATYTSAMGVAAKNGIAYMTEPDYNMVGLTGLPTSGVLYTAVNVAGRPWSIALITLNGVTYPVVYAQQSMQLSLFDANLNLITAPTVTGVTSSDQLQYMDGGFQLVAFDSCTAPAVCPAAGTVALLSEADNKLYFFSVDPATKSMTQGATVTLAGIPSRISANQSAGAVVVASFNDVTVQTDYLSVNVATGAATPLNAKSAFFATGLGADASSVIRACNAKICSVQPIQ